jgi:hypothetical protein
MNKVTHYIVTKDNVMDSLVAQTACQAIAVYDNGDTLRTNLPGYVLGISRPIPMSLSEQKYDVSVRDFSKDKDAIVKVKFI